MAIDFEIIKKLIRLANNNPSEHEANAAARRVCKKLEEGNWSGLVTETKSKREATLKVERDERTAETVIRITDLSLATNQRIKDLLKALQDEIARPNQYSNAYDKPPQYSGFKYPPSSEQEEYYRRQGFTGGFKSGFGGGKWDSFYGRNPFTDENNPFYRNMRDEPQRHSKPMTERECTKCGLKVNTANTQNPFVCNICQWAAYEQSKKGPAST